MGGGGGDIEETEAERAQAEVALKRWGDYENIFKPYENEFMDEVDDLNSEANYTRATELAISPLANQFAEEAMGIKKQMQASGVNPNSGKMKSFNSAVAGAQAGAEVDTASRATEAQQDRYIGGLQNIVAMGQGQAGQAMQGMTDIAVTSQQNARSQAQSALQDRDNIRSGVGAVVGAGTSYGLNAKNSTPIEDPDTSKAGII